MFSFAIDIRWLYRRCSGNIKGERSGVLPPEPCKHRALLWFFYEVLGKFFLGIRSLKKMTLKKITLDNDIKKFYL